MNESGTIADARLNVYIKIAGSLLGGLIIISSFLYPISYDVERFEEREGILSSCNQTKHFQLGDLDEGKLIDFDCRFNSVGILLLVTSQLIIESGQTTSFSYLDWYVGYYIKSEFVVRSYAMYYLLVSKLSDNDSLSYLLSFKVLSVIPNALPGILLATGVATLFSVVSKVVREIIKSCHRRIQQGRKKEKDNNSRYIIAWNRALKLFIW